MKTVKWTIKLDALRDFIIAIYKETFLQDIIFWSANIYYSK